MPEGLDRWPRKMGQHRFRTFWLVWSPAGSAPPRHRHETHSSAQAEAERLARANPGSPFYVLRAEACSEMPAVLTTLSEAFDAEIPF